MLVGLVTWTSAIRYGLSAGVASGFSLLVMPRCFAHAHLGALDTFIAFFWVLALLGSDRALSSRRPILAMCGAGVLFSLALLTKIHAWFLIPVVFVWTIVRLGFNLRAVVALTAWFLTGFSLFVIGWPWLWSDPVKRLLAYLGTGVDRVSIRVLYLGQVYVDKDVPWHYPWVYFAVTVPVGLQILGALGLIDAFRSYFFPPRVKGGLGGVAAGNPHVVSAKTSPPLTPPSQGGEKDRRTAQVQCDPFPLLLLGSIAMFVVLFSTRVPVYDGERLFLMVFPLWAILIGREFGAIWVAISGKTFVRAGFAVFLILQGYGVVTTHPFGLSYYNAIVGGLSGAEQLGFEVTYWGDSVDRVFLERLVQEVPAKATVALVPTLYPGQGIVSTTPAMARKPVLLADQEAISDATWLVVTRRTAYWPNGLETKLQGGRLVYQRRCGTTWLAALYQLGPQKTTRPGVSGSPSSNVQGPPSQSPDD